ncbi:lysine--tRNA ligase [Candidatus Pacearchaeota archaeon]|nr:lysine--tRNA ligase [Candidatus Pacearchaeota archaeon]
MGREEEILKERQRKIAELKAQGINPYPYSFKKTHSSKALQEKYSKLTPDERTKDKASVAGRVMTIRDLGQLIFVTIQDSEGKLQVVLQNKETETKSFDLFKKFVDSGDFVGFEGIVFKTKRGEVSILVKKLEILTKSLLPLPEKWHGIQDKEERYRKRYLDLIMNPEVKKVFEQREKIIEAIREFLKSRGFNEVDTPYLQTIYGGAEARPFKTHLNALDIDLFLAISPELYLKRLIVGGFEKVFSMARNFRNEGIDRWHNPEFTMMEIYQAYADYNDMMELTEDIYCHVCKKVFGTTKIQCQGKEIDFKKPWARMTMAEAIKKFAGIDVLKMNEKQLLDFVKKNNVEYKHEGWGWLIAALFEHYCEKELIQPTFVTDHPRELTPLCKAHRKDSRLIERFEPFCLGAEMANAYSELNDPKIQRELLENQQKLLAGGDEEANPFDSDFVNAIEVGMPPTGGLGIGIDRMVIMLTGQESIRDILLFPFMKPETLNENKEEKQVKKDKKEDKPVKSKTKTLKKGAKK